MKACCSGCSLLGEPRPSIVVISLLATVLIRRDAGTDRLAIDQHRASAALRQAAAEFGAVELEVVAQHVEQRRVRLSGNRTAHPIDCQVGSHACRSHGLPVFFSSVRSFCAVTCAASRLSCTFTTTTPCLARSSRASPRKNLQTSRR